MTQLIVAYALALVVFIGIDLVWLMGVARSLYVEEMGALLRKQPIIGAAVAFYLLYIAGLMLFAIAPGLAAGSPLKAAMLGAAMGLVAYGTYDLTNLAVVEGYTLRIALIDLAWGAVLTGLTAGIVCALAPMIVGR
jgi:uncharacterized membrane protein